MMGPHIADLCSKERSRWYPRLVFFAAKKDIKKPTYCFQVDRCVLVIKPCGHMVQMPYYFTPPSPLPPAARAPNNTQKTKPNLFSSADLTSMQSRFLKSNTQRSASRSQLKGQRENPDPAQRLRKENTVQTVISRSHCVAHETRSSPTTIQKQSKKKEEKRPKKRKEKKRKEKVIKKRSPNKRHTLNHDPLLLQPRDIHPGGRDRLHHRLA